MPGGPGVLRRLHLTYISRLRHKRLLIVMFFILLAMVHFSFLTVDIGKANLMVRSKKEKDSDNLDKTQETPSVTIASQTIYDLIDDIKRESDKLSRCSSGKHNFFANKTDFLQTTDSNVQRPNCSEDKIRAKIASFFRIQNGYLVARIDLLGLECCYREVFADGDDAVLYSAKCNKIKRSDSISLKNITSDLIKVVCKNKSTNLELYKEGFNLVMEKHAVESRIKAFETSGANSRLSVILIGLHNTSQYQFERLMPKTKKYLEQTLFAVTFKGFNRIAEASLPNFLGLLTGRTMKEFMQECVPNMSNHFGARLDNCSFIWKIFASNGYRTGFSEDEVTKHSLLNTNFRFAFENGAPTDYYWRPYSILMERILHEGKGYCYGHRLSFEVLLENIKAMAVAFKNKRYFKFAYSSRLSQAQSNMMTWADEPFVQLLKFLHDEGHLENTALIITGDNRISSDKDFFEADATRLESLKPPLYVALPSWFRDSYSTAFSNLRENANVLTTPFDSFRTLLDFIDLGRLTELKNETSQLLFQPINTFMASRSQSLFDKVPERRSCPEAGIPLVWCPCYKRTQIAVASILAMEASVNVMKEINERIKKNPECLRLSLESIRSASIVHAYDVHDYLERKSLRKECKPVLNMNVEGNLNNNRRDNNASHKAELGCVQVVNVRKQSSGISLDDDHIVLNIVLVAQPGDAIFEASVYKVYPVGAYSVIEDIVRIDEHSGKSVCSRNGLSRRFCTCKSYLKMHRNSSQHSLRSTLFHRYD